MSGRRLRALHVASFVGNIGDNAMHDGAYRMRAADIGLPFTHDRVEIRDVIHWGRARFDQAFLDRANAADLVIFGGDSLFPLRSDDGPSGTYLGVAADYLDAIDRPVVFYGLGADGSRGIDPAVLARARATVERLLARPDRLVSLRQDGSAALLGLAGDPRVAVIPDGGLFAEVAPMERPEIDPALDWIAVNLAGDMAEIRFRDLPGGEAGFLDRLAEALSRLTADEDRGLLLQPHIHADLGLIARLVSRLDDRFRRGRLVVGPYVQGEAGWQVGFDGYLRAASVVAMRFHAALVPLGLGRPVIGLDSHVKIGGLFAGLGLADRALDVAAPDFTDRLVALVEGDLADPADVLARQAAGKAGARADLAAFHQRIAKLVGA